MHNEKLNDAPSVELIARYVGGLATPADQDVVRRWRAASSGNEAEYRRIERLIELSGRLPEATGYNMLPPTAEAVLARVARGQRPQVGDNMPAFRHRARSRRRIVLTLASAALLLVTLTFLARWIYPAEPGFRAETFFAGPTESATVTLRDGTVVRLSPGTTLELHSSRGERRVSLNGRAFFAVSHQKDAPFIVRTHNGEIRVLGTRFDLMAEGDDLQLVVVQGSVAVRTAGMEEEVRGGQLSRVYNGVPLPVVDAPNHYELTAWVGQFLAFQATPLADAIKEVSQRYDVHIEITDEMLGRRTITGWFAEWALEDLMMVICTVAEANCRFSPAGITIEPMKR